MSKAVNVSNGFVDRLKSILDKHGITQAKMASDTDLGPSMLSQIINGQRLPGISFLKSVCAIYGYSFEWLANGVGEPRPMIAYGTLDRSEIECVEMYRKISDEEKKKALKAVLKSMSESE